MKLYLIALMLACSIKGYTQEQAPVFFSSPFNVPLALSGNFGELRSNHFHSGVDFKTGGISQPVKALANGYISKIRVTNGSGYILEVTYNNGYRTINRHLDRFISPIAERVKKLQYEKENWEVEISPNPDEYPVKSGQQIAWSGNTGYSIGPHLHLEVLETATGNYIDPLPLLRKFIKDTRAPQAQGIMFFPQPGKGVIEGNKSHKVIAPNSPQPVIAWGWIGVGIKAYDYMNNTYNHYGVHSVELAVDGKSVFKSEIDRFSYEENRFINAWTYASYMKSFIEPGNNLRLLKAYNDQSGLIHIDEERDYDFQYTLKDVFGNTSSCRFTVRGKKQDIPQLEHCEKFFFEWSKTNYLQEPGMTLVIPRGMLYNDIDLVFKVKPDSGAVAFTYQLHDKPIALHAGCELNIGIRNKVIADTTKYYVARVLPNGALYSAGGTYENGFMKTSINELGTYTVRVDTIKPLITPIAKAAWGRNRKIGYRVSDSQTGIRFYRGTIDGEYALFRQPNTTRPQWECVLDSERIKKGGRHTVEFVAIDNCGNLSISRDYFIW